jgi:3-(methylthio)propionyl---CoA ligase
MEQLMQGLMMQQPLLVSALLTHAQRHHGEQEVVSRRVEGGIHRYTYAQLAARARCLANALRELGVKPSDCVATLAWNGYRHLELYYAASGSGAVLHTLNPRLHAQQLLYMLEHAEDRVLFFDLSFLPIVETLAPHLGGRLLVALCDRSHMPVSQSGLKLLCYEELLARHSDEFLWPALDEDAACSLCYTSGTTGRPKGVLYSHRSTVLHAYAAALPDSLDCSARSVILPVVPMFHVNAWGLPYIACLVGAKLVLPGPALDGKSLYELIETERVTVSAGVPTVWQGLLHHVRASGVSFSSMRRTIIGGSACPPVMLEEFESAHDVTVVHAWGMTELSPLGTVCSFKSRHSQLTAEQQRRIQLTQGRVPFGIDMRIVDAAGCELPRDGRSAGELMVRGHWVASGYFRTEGETGTRDGWFPTGDIATIDADGFMHITDRSKDVIKSGGEWISSIELESIAALHPDVAAAACIAARHPKWDERPVLVVVRKPDAELDERRLLEFFADRVPKWWLPDAVCFVDSLPLGVTGKVLKQVLRERYRDVLAQ